MNSMNNILVFCQTDADGIMEVSLELLTKGRELAGKSGQSLEAIVIGDNIKSVDSTLYKYGAQTVYVADDKRLKNYTTQPFCKIICHVTRQTEPSVILFGATRLGRDLAPRVAAELHTGITADCTRLEIADYTDSEGKVCKNILQEIRPSFIGNQLTTIIEPYRRPQMATVREGVMIKKTLDKAVDGKSIILDVNALLSDEKDFPVRVISEAAFSKPNGLKNANVVIAGGYGVGSCETFERLGVLAEMLGGEIGATRAAVDAGYVSYDRMIGQTGLTVSPKLYIAFGISGQVQHTVGMDRSSVIVAVNTDANAPIHRIADYSIIGETREVVEKMIYTLKNEKL